MDPTPAEGPRVVVGVDDTVAARWALAWAIGEARLRCLPLLIVHTARLPNHVAAPGLVNADVVNALRAMGAHLIAGLLDEVAGGTPADVRMSALSLVGDPGDTLVRLARDTDVLIVGRGARSPLSRLLRPSVQRLCARRTRAVFMCVGPPAPRGSRRRPASLLGTASPGSPAALDGAQAADPRDPAAAPASADSADPAAARADPAGRGGRDAKASERSLLRRIWAQRRYPRRARAGRSPREAAG